MNYPVYMDVTEGNKIEIPLREVKRYLGYGRVEMTPEVAELARELIDEAREIMRPRACYTRLAVTFMDYPRMDFGFGIVESRHLWRNLSDGTLYDCTTPAPSESINRSDSDTSDFSEHLISVTDNASGRSGSDATASGQPIPSGARECFLFAATIGPQMDVQIRRLARTSPSKSLILQAVGAAAIEAYCDLLEVRMAGEVAGEGLSLLPRFSPGYGDFSLTHQRDFFRVLDPPRRAGITLTDQLLMVPEKSVTAVIGLTKAEAGTACRPEQEASRHRCEVCSSENCSFRIC